MYSLSRIPGVILRAEHLSSIRFYRRKPRWLGFAKSKEFVVPKPKDWTENESKEYELLEIHHKRYMDSLWAYQKVKYEESILESTAHARQVSEEGEIDEIIKQIEYDNAIVKELREKYQLEQKDKLLEELLAKRTEYEEEQKIKLENTEKKVAFQMERLKTAITPEKLDEAIEKALSSTVNYNFCIDRNGSIYR